MIPLALNIPKPTCPLPMQCFEPVSFFAKLELLAL